MDNGAKPPSKIERALQVLNVRHCLIGPAGKGQRHFLFAEAYIGIENIVWPARAALGFSKPFAAVDRVFSLTAERVSLGVICYRRPRIRTINAFARQPLHPRAAALIPGRTGYLVNPSNDVM